MNTRTGRSEDQYKQVFLSKEVYDLLTFACEIEHTSRQQLVNKILKKKLKKIISKFGKDVEQTFDEVDFSDNLTINK